MEAKNCVFIHETSIIVKYGLFELREGQEQRIRHGVGVFDSGGA
jgi:hypothetical protein